MDSAQSAFTGMGLNQMQGILSAYKLYLSSADGSKDANDAAQEAMVNRYAEMLIQWADLVDLRPSEAVTAPVMVAAKLTPDALARQGHPEGRQPPGGHGTARHCFLV